MTRSKSRRSHMMLRVAFVGALVCNGCGQSSNDDADALTLPTTPTNEAESFTRTVVHLGPDGTSTESVSTISARDQRAEIATTLTQSPDKKSELPTGVDERNGPEHLGTTRQAITNTSSCSGSDLRMFDQANYVGNEICFYGGGWTGSLSNYCRIWAYHGVLLPPSCLATWSAATRSYLVGVSGGELWDGRIVDPCYEYFDAYTSHATVGTCAARSSRLYLQDPPVYQCTRCF